MSKKKKVQLGVGLDVGTMNLVSARARQSDGKVSYNRIRDAFLSLDKEDRKMLKRSGMAYVDREDDLIVVGDDALELASVIQTEARRPLAAGLVSSAEVDSLEVLGILVRSVLGDPQEEGEICYFSVPAAPIDAERDVIYHKRAFERIISECGYEAYPSNEAMAIMFAEGAKDGYTGISFSFGSGMTNVALSFKTRPVLEFSISRGGDWIDGGAAKSLPKTTRSRICRLKEAGINLLDPKEGTESRFREREALSFYYMELIDYALAKVAEQFTLHCQIELTEPIPIIVSGGTSLAGGFMDLFKKVFRGHRRRFPVQISEIRHADKPLNAVARGLLIQAMEEYEDL